jgi:hypothetical protein
MAVMSTGHHRAWSGRELADQLKIKLRNMLTQVAE